MTAVDDHDDDESARFGRLVAGDTRSFVVVEVERTGGRASRRRSTSCSDDSRQAQLHQKLRVAFVCVGRLSSSPTTIALSSLFDCRSARVSEKKSAFEPQSESTECTTRPADAPKLITLLAGGRSVGRSFNSSWCRLKSTASRPVGVWRVHARVIARRQRRLGCRVACMCAFDRPTIVSELPRPLIVRTDSRVSAVD